MINNQFMIKGTTAANLYNQFVKDAPIYDYHCHLSAKEIYEDKAFLDISSLWLEHDHYKWRVMRYAGVAEENITGSADCYAKFKSWAKTCERLAGSPLYHWANMELKAYFGIDEILKENNAQRIYDLCNAKIIADKLSPVKMIKDSNVKLICTTDDPIDNLKYHRLLADRNDFKVLPTFRPDKALNIQNVGFLDYVANLSQVSGVEILSYKDFIKALDTRVDFFKKSGCLLSDHSLESLTFTSSKAEEIEGIFTARLSNKKISKEDAEKFKMHTLVRLSSEYKKAGWIMQLHIGALRNTNDTMFHKLGADAGFDVMNDFNIAEPLARLLNEMDKNNELPKTILFTLNSKDNVVLSALAHCFPEDGIPGKVQFGTAWWFNDHKEGIINHLKAIASQGMLADFVGMLTDSRSFLSYVRHDYFRRIFCSYLGELVDNGEFEKDEAILKEIVEGVCFKNIKSYLGLEE